MLTLLAPAKINLTLEVLAKRPDGFHEIRSVIQAINLCDSLRFQISEDIELKSATPGWIPEESLVSRAVNLLQDMAGCRQGVTIEVSKRIPAVSGLGGDSSDAAATLRGLNRLWRLGLSPDELVRLAWQLGSDVAFFFYGGTALAEGRGEKVMPLPPLPHLWVVLMVPPVPLPQKKTERLYDCLNAGHYTDGQVTDRLVARLARCGTAGLPEVFNVFDGVATGSYPGLEIYRQQFGEAGAGDVHLAGSGPALFTLVGDKAQAERIYRRLQQQGLESYLTDTLPTLDKVEGGIK